MDFIVPHFMVYVIIYWDFDMSENNVWIPFILHRAIPVTSVVGYARKTRERVLKKGLSNSLSTRTHWSFYRIAT